MATRDAQYTLTPFSKNKILHNRNKHKDPMRDKHESVINCQRCGQKLMLGDRVVSKCSKVRKMLYHKKCYDGMFL